VATALLVTAASAQAATYHRIRTASPAYTGFLADGQVAHPQLGTSSLPSFAVVSVTNPVDPAANWRLDSRGPATRRGDLRLGIVNRATGRCLTAARVVNQGYTPAMRACTATAANVWFLVLGGRTLRSFPTPGDYQFRSGAPDAAPAGLCLDSRNRLALGGVALVIFDSCRTRSPSTWELRPPFTATP
jgi:hypothetical protein